jgi:hypothetical protein
VFRDESDHYRRDDAYFRVFDYYFSLRCAEPKVLQYIRRVLGEFEVEPDVRERRVPPTPNIPPCYTVLRSGTSEEGVDAYTLSWGTEPLLADVGLSAVLDRLFWHVNNEATRRAAGFLLVHAGAVVAPSGGALVLPAASGSGKTTLVAALVRSGYRYLSDEAAAIDPVLGLIHAFPKAMTLKRGSFDLFPDVECAPHVGAADQRHVLPQDLGGSTAPDPAPPRWVIGIQYAAGSTGRLTPLSAGATVALLGKHELNLRFYRSRALTVFERLARQADGFSFTYGSVAAAVDAIDELCRAREV